MNLIACSGAIYALIREVKAQIATASAARDWRLVKRLEERRRHFTLAYDAVRRVEAEMTREAMAVPARQGMERVA